MARLVDHQATHDHGRPVPAPHGDRSRRPVRRFPSRVTVVATATCAGYAPRAAVSSLCRDERLSLNGMSVRSASARRRHSPCPRRPGLLQGRRGAWLLPLRGVWQPLAELPSRFCPPQPLPYLTPPAGMCHLTAVRISLFAAGTWGDRARRRSSHVSRSSPRDHREVRRGSSWSTAGSRSHQAHSTHGAAADAPTAAPQNGARLGRCCRAPTKTMQALQLQPGALPFRLRSRPGPAPCEGTAHARSCQSTCLGGSRPCP